MTGNRGWFPSMVISRVYNQHRIRKMELFTPISYTKKRILLNILKLSTSQYSKVRKAAQRVMKMSLKNYPNTYVIMAPHIIEILKKDPTEHHDAYKVLYN